MARIHRIYEIARGRRTKMDRASFIFLAVQLTHAVDDRSDLRQGENGSAHADALSKITSVRFYQVPNIAYRKGVTSAEVRAGASLEIRLREVYLDAGMHLLRLALKEPQGRVPDVEEGKVNYRWALVGVDDAGKELAAAFFGVGYVSSDVNIEVASQRERKIANKLRDLLDSLLKHGVLPLDDRRRLFGGP